MNRKTSGKIIPLIMLSAMIFSGCGSTVIDDYATNEGYSHEASQESAQFNKAVADAAERSNTAQSQSSGISKEDIKVGIIHNGDPADGSGYSYTHDIGIQGMQANLGLSDSQIDRKINVDDSDTQAITDAIQECIDDGCNIIFTTSWGYMDVTEEMAEKNPDIYFAHATGYKSNQTNFTNYFGRIYQPRYLSGIVAGMNTSSNKIGYVAAQGVGSSEVTGGIDAFAIGVYEVNPDAEVYVKVTDSWYDPEAEEAAATELLDMGCDVMAQHCDTPYPQTLAQERGVYGIGYNSDMSMETPDSCLASVIWNWSAYYTEFVQSIIDGTYDGSNYYGGLSDGLVELTSLADFCAEGTSEKVNEAAAKINSGEFNVFDGVLETNDGSTVGSEGSTLDDSTITGSINWYYKNVVVIE